MKLSIISSIIAVSLQASGVLSAALAVRDGPLLFQSPSSFNKDHDSITGKPISGDSPVQLCDVNLPQLLSIDHINISPNPPLKGENLTIEASGILSSDVEDGAYINVVVTYGYIRLLSQTFDLCEQVEQVDLKCPLKKGPLSISKQVELPSEIPPGQYTAIAKAYTAKDKLITCLETRVTFSVSMGSLFGKPQ